MPGWAQPAASARAHTTAARALGRSPRILANPLTFQRATAHPQEQCRATEMGSREGTRGHDSFCPERPVASTGGAFRRRLWFCCRAAGPCLPRASLRRGQDDAFDVAAQAAEVFGVVAVVDA